MASVGQAGKSASKSKSKKNQPSPPEEEIVYSGQALQIAAGWLGITDVEAELKEEDDKQSTKATGARSYNKHTGLGAAAPSKQQAGIAGVAHRLGQKVLQSSKSRTGGRDFPERGGHVYGVSKNQVKEEDSSDESEGRGAAIGKGKKRIGSAPQRGDLLATGGSKKRKGAGAVAAGKRK